MAVNIGYLCNNRGDVEHKTRHFQKYNSLFLLADILKYQEHCLNFMSGSVEILQQSSGLKILSLQIVLRQYLGHVTSCVRYF